MNSGSSVGSTYLDLFRVPNRITAYCGLEDSFSLVRSGERWTGRSVELTTSPSPDELAVSLSAPKDALTHLHVRWSASVSNSLLCLGDAWERSYGDLAWRSLVPERPMPWYFATWGGTTHCYGVKTGARALCFWQLDPEGLSLWLDVSNGGSGVILGERLWPHARWLQGAVRPAKSPFKRCESCAGGCAPAEAVAGAGLWF